MECVVADNNALSLPKSMADYGRSASSLATAMLNEGKSPQEISAALSKHAKGDHPEGQDPARGLLVAWGAGASVVGGTIVGPITGAAAVIGGGILGGATDVTKQFLTLKPGEHYSATDTLIAVGTGALTQGKGTLFSTLVNTGGAYLGSKVKGEDPTTSMLGNAVGTVIGNKVGGSLPMKCFLKVILIKLPRLVGKLCWSCNRLHCRRRYKENTRKKKINNKRSVIFRLKQFIYLILGWGIVFSVCCMISIPLAYLIIFFKERYFLLDIQPAISGLKFSIKVGGSGGAIFGFFICLFSLIEEFCKKFSSLNKNKEGE
ncbi:hypothetical protein [Photorhabdus heterorhabditis]|uniref:hypothetical protein n=1 Tax=Photorhabdus heterorhabditis TaxID=880156 RepID=UPI001FD1AEC6|nr:hypothetical protein [Photorhabdus heterorhabditis]